MPLKEPVGACVVEPSLLGKAEILEPLYVAEAPVLYTTRDASGRVLLAYVADETADATWLVLAACSPPMLSALMRGHLAVREALTSSLMWLVRKAPDGTLVQAWAIGPDHLPPEHLPAPATLLLPDCGPAIAT